MVRFYRLTLLLLLALFGLSTVENASAQLPSGKEFLVTVPSYWRQVDLGEPGVLQITIMCSRTTNVKVRWSGPAGAIIDEGTIGAGNRLTVQSGFKFPLVNLMQPFWDKIKQEVNQRSFYIEADKPVSVMAIYEDYRNNGSNTTAWAVAPLETYSTDFLGMTYMGTIGKNSGFVITAAEDSTEVTFDPTVQWDSPTNNVLTPVTITLKKHQVFQVPSFSKGGTSSSDLTGTQFRSNKPIGVHAFAFRSNADIEFPDDTTNAYQYNWRLSAMSEVMLPETYGGTRFYTAPMGPQDTSAVRVMALEDGTAVSFNSVAVAVLDRGEWTTQRIGRATRIDADKPVMAMQIVRSGNNPQRDTLIRINGDPKDTVRIEPIVGNPDMAWLPPVSQYKNTLQWTNPRPSNRKTPIPGRDSITLYPWIHYAQITAPTSAISSVLLDGNPVDFQFTHIDGAYSTAVVAVTPSQHLLTSDAPVSCIAYGYGWDEGYALVSSEALRSIASVDVDTVRLSTCDSTAEVTFELSNLGNNTFQIDSIRADGVTIRSTRRPNEYPTFFPPGRQLDVQIVLSLPQTREYTGTFFLYTDANNVQRIEVPFKVVRDSARFEVVPNVDFGLVPNGVTTKDTSIVLKNTGLFPVTITDLDFDSPQFEVISPSLPRVLPSGGSMTIKVRLTPRPGFPEAGKLQIIGDPCMAPITIPYTGFKGAGPLLTVDRVITFPPVLCESPGSRDSIIVLRSGGDEPITITSATITGPNSALFTLVDNPAPTTITPGTSDTIVVRYTPVGFGLHQATLNLKTNASNAPDPLTIALSGRIDTATAEPRRRTINLPSIKSCDPDPIIDLTLTNSGTVDAVIGTVAFDEEDVPFSVTSAQSFTIPPAGVDRIVSVRFSPTREGTFTGTLRVTGDPCGIDEVITIVGTRTDPKLELVEQTIDLGSVLYCGDALSGTITLRNSGTLVDTIERYSPSGSDRFSLADPGFPIILQPGEERTLEVTFDPETPGSFTSQFEFSWGPCDNTTTASVNAELLDVAVGVDANDLDLGAVDIDAGESTGTIQVTNTGDVPREIALILDATSGSGLRVVSPTGLSVLQPGESVSVTVGFDPTDTGEVVATLIVESADPCSTSDTVNISGTGTGSVEVESRLVIETPEGQSGNVNDRVGIPIRVGDASTIESGIVTEIEVSLRFNAGSLFPETINNLAPGVTGVILSNSIENGSERVVRFRFSGSTIAPGVELGRLTALVLLGNASETPLIIEDLTPTVEPGNIVVLLSGDGDFSTLGVCEIDGERLLSIGGGLKVLPPRPAPAFDVTEVPFIVDDEGWHTLVIYDAAGNQLLTIPLGELQSGGYSTTVDLSDIPAGYYRVEINNRRERVSVPLLVRK